MMNCLETRRAFAAFWRRSMASEERAAVTGHLAECARCDHSFRVFALTAPVLHGAPATPRAAGRAEPIPASRSGRAVSVRAINVISGNLTSGRWGGVAAAFAMGAAAAVALYFSAPPRVNFEDAIGTTAPSSAVTSDNRESLFGLLLGQDDQNRDSTQPATNQLESGQGRDNGLAG